MRAVTSLKKKRSDNASINAIKGTLRALSAASVGLQRALVVRDDWSPRSRILTSHPDFQRKTFAQCLNVPTQRCQGIGIIAPLFNPGDLCLRHRQTLGDFGLGQTGCLPGFHQLQPKFLLGGLFFIDRAKRRDCTLSGRSQAGLQHFNIAVSQY